MVEFNFLRKKANNNDIFVFIIIISIIVSLLLAGLYFYYDYLNIKEKSMEKNLYKKINLLKSTERKLKEKHAWMLRKNKADKEAGQLLKWLESESFEKIQIQKIEKTKNILIITLYANQKDAVAILRKQLFKYGFETKSISFIGKNLKKLVLTGIHDHL